MHGTHRSFHRLTLRIDDPDAMHLQVNHIAFLQIDNLIGRAGQRHGIGREKIFTFTDTDNERGTLTRTDHSMRFIAGKDGDRKGTGQAFDRQLHGLEQIAGVQVVHQMRDHFGIGLAFKYITRCAQFST